MTPETRDDIRGRYARGDLLRDISAATGVSISRVSEVAKALGLPRRRRGARTNPEAPSRIAARLVADQGWRVADAADHLGISCQAIYHTLSKSRPKYALTTSPDNGIVVG